MGESILTVAALAAAKSLSVDWLREQGVADLPGGGVSICYYERDGMEMFRRARDVPGSGRRFSQPKGTGLRPYGLWKLDDWHNAATPPALYLTEGESDCWSLWDAGLPALGLPGNNAFACLTRSDLVGIDTIYVCPDGDDAGKELVAGLRRHLGWLGYAGRLYLVELPGGCKDVCDFRHRDPAGFRDRFRQLVAEALPSLVERPAGSDHVGLNGAAPARSQALDPFGDPIPASMLRAGDPALSWIWNGFLRRGEVTLLAALWKAGKTTLLAHLLRALGKGGEFLGRQLIPSRVLYVTEESEARWAARRDAVGLEDHIHFLVRPFATKPRHERWEEFLHHVGGLIESNGYDVVVMDTLANLWPVRDENDASAVQAALMPLHSMIDRVALQLVHHTRKSDGSEATASRGSGALTGFVDTIVEFRRYLPGERGDRRRVLSGYGRHDETPQELVIELTDGGYVAHGDRESIQCRELGDIIATVLPPRRPGLNADQILEAWPEDTRPGRNRFFAALKAGVDCGAWQRSGSGKKGSPYLFWLLPDESDVSPFDNNT